MHVEAYCSLCHGGPVDSAALCADHRTGMARVQRHEAELRDRDRAFARLVTAGMPEADAEAAVDAC